MAGRLPSVFVGHGDPRNAVFDNEWTAAWQTLAAGLDRPRAVLCVSAHWYTPFTGVTAMSRPRTIHDFGGFEPFMYEIQYPAPGDPELASRVAGLLEPLEVARDEEWGLDHGSWSVLRQMYPDADVPVVQLSIDGRQPAAYHLDLGARLTALRDEGVLILGSGNVVHNLGAARFGDDRPYPWAEEFDHAVAGALENDDRDALVNWQQLPGAAMSHPSPDHWYPLHYALGARQPGEPARTLCTGSAARSISMRSVRFG